MDRDVETMFLKSGYILGGFRPVLGTMEGIVMISSCKGHVGNGCQSFQICGACG